MCEINLVVSYITMYNRWCLVCHIFNNCQTNAKLQYKCNIKMNAMYFTLHSMIPQGLLHVCHEPWHVGENFIF
jgi:hypothetical protein